MPRLHCSIDVLFRLGVLRVTHALLQAEQIAAQQPKLARQVAFEMARERPPAAA